MTVCAGEDFPLSHPCFIWFWQPCEGGGQSRISHLYFFVSSLLCLLGFPGGLAAKESACNAGDLGSIPGLGRSPGEENGYPFHSTGTDVRVGP